MDCGSLWASSWGREGGSVDEITMTDAHSSGNGGGRHERGRDGARGRRTGALRGSQSGCSRAWQRRCTRARCADRADDEHAAHVAVRALVNVEMGHAQPERLDGFGLLGLGHARTIKRRARLCELLALGAVGENAVVANAHEAWGQHVEQEAADELGCVSSSLTREHPRATTLTHQGASVHTASCTPLAPLLDFESLHPTVKLRPPPRKRFSSTLNDLPKTSLIWRVSVRSLEMLRKIMTVYRAVQDCALVRLRTEDQVFVFSRDETPHDAVSDFPDIGLRVSLSKKQRSV